MIHVESTVSVAGMWAVVDDGRVLAVRTTRERAMMECSRLRGVQCRECDIKCAYGDVVDVAEISPLVAAAATERL